MNCLEFRRIVGAEPHASTPDVVAHAAECPQCARYQSEMQQMDALIHRALNVQPRFDGEAEAPQVAPPTAVPSPQRTRRRLQWGLAASVVLAVFLGSLWLGYPRQTLAEQIVVHVEHEADSMVRTDTAVDRAALQDVLVRSGVRLRDIGRVSYAMSCTFRGHHVPHLVVQTAGGPVTVLLLPEERAVSAPQKFAEGGYAGVILPAPRGAIAVLGEGAPVADVATTVLESIEYIT
jgi:Protein of unknown function (DUF3379)